ncbi:DUF3310 domain-containing protein [Mammaliicoccus sciuri]|uniref:DUF3310 domain-containing protein n=1 Tax=Mammaliicoccus sciuri TaxID=1296 RepID=UPI00289AF07A|nr:DUF3310 domain-containing protein [Mammaliicoccus sciuri]
MEFKAGDRVHVTRFNGNPVDFYATLKETETVGVFCLIDCTYHRYEAVQVYTPKTKDFGPDETDYYTLATDEEDSEEPIIQRTTDNVNHPSHYNYGDIEVIDYCDQVCKQYPSDLAPYVFNAIKYLSRSEYKNGKEDVAKAKFYIQRLFDKWDDSHE